jgi:hypothetical protein
MIATMVGAVCVTESGSTGSMLIGVYINESLLSVTAVFIIHPFV